MRHLKLMLLSGVASILLSGCALSGAAGYIGAAVTGAAVMAENVGKIKDGYVEIKGIFDKNETNTSKGVNNGN